MNQTAWPAPHVPAFQGLEHFDICTTETWKTNSNPDSRRANAAHTGPADSPDKYSQQTSSKTSRSKGKNAQKHLKLVLERTD